MSIDTLIKLAGSFERDCFEDLKVAHARKLGGKYLLIKKRLNDIDYSNRQEEQEADAKEKEAEGIIDLTGAIDFSYSAIMREMRQKASKEQVRYFLTLFKKEFDKAVKSRLQNPEKIALQNSLVKFNKKHKVKCKKKLIKNAAVSELGEAALVGKYLADIVKFTLNKLPVEKRSAAIEKLRSKFYSFNADEMSQKALPPTAAIGQSISFVKHVLVNQNPLYIREVLNNLASNL
jgi:hypothetical protein